MDEKQDEKTWKSRWESLPEWKGQCIAYRIEVGKSAIGYVNAIMEGYDMVARVRTDDIRRGVVSILVPEEMDGLFRDIIRSIGSTKTVKYL